MASFDPLTNPYFTGQPQQVSPRQTFAQRFPGPKWLQGMSGGFDKIMGGMAGPANPMLSQQEQEADMQRRKMAMAAALLQASGPRPQGTSGPMQAFGDAISAGQQAGSQATDDALRMRMIQAQLGRGSQGTASIQEYELAKSQGYAGSYTDFKKEFEGREANLPSNVAEWNFYNALPSDKAKAEYLEVKRAGRIENVNSVPTYVPPGVGSGVAQPQPLSTIETEEEAKRRLAAATAGGAATGGAQGTAAASLPQAEATAQTALETIEQLRTHPGRVQATGASRMSQVQRVPGTSAYDFETLRKQASGQVFLNAYQQLKGGGVITEIEGQKAEQAIARMDAAQSEEAYLDALDEYEVIINRGLETARRRAGVASPAAQLPEGVTEDDIATTMQLRGMTREQVLERLNAR